MRGKRSEKEQRKREVGEEGDRKTHGGGKRETGKQKGEKEKDR